MPAREDTFINHPNEFFIETGAGSGDGLSIAIKGPYKELRSCELGDWFIDTCKKRFNNDPRIKLYLGSSENTLWDMIKDINVPCTFWLDAHYGGPGMAQGRHICPLLIELDIISQHPVKTHTILIDDMRCCGTPLFPNIQSSDVLHSLLKINPNYNISFQEGLIPNDILVVKELLCKF
jgi:hypothetical protein